MAPRMVKIEKKNGSLARFIKVECGQSHQCAIDSQGYLYTWGANTQNCLGLPFQEDLVDPYLVFIYLKKKIKKLKKLIIDRRTQRIQNY